MRILTARVASLRRGSRIRTLLALALLVFVLPAGLPLAAQGGFTPRDVARVRRVTAAEISPDGTRIAYLLEVPRQPLEEEDGPVWSELHVVDQSGASRPFVTGRVNVSNVGWTPDGSSIAFLAKRGHDEHKSLYLIPADGGEARRVLSHATDISAYSFSPDGRQAAFLATEAVPEKKEKLKKKGFAQEIYEEEVPFVRVWIAALGEKTGKARMLDLPGSASELHWYPADAYLVVALAPTPLVDDEYMSRKVYVVDVDTGKVYTKIENPGKLGQVAWDPAEKHLAIISAADINDPAAGRLTIAPAHPGEKPFAPRDILPGFEGHVTHIAWQDSATVMYLADEGVWTTFNKVNIDGSGRKVIIPAGGPILTDFTLSQDGQAAAFVGESPAHPSEVFAMKHGEAAPRRLTHSNPWLTDIKLAAQEVVRFRARDGLELEGILIRPLNEERGKRYPLILVIHGGPESHYRNGWLTSYASPGQTAAARSFAVFYPNYRASTGRGVAFSKLDYGDFAGKEFDDYVDGANHLIAAGLVDRGRVGITGGSYGGYASAWGATYYSDRFAAAVALFGISDNISKEGTSDIPEEMRLVHQRFRPWENWQLFLERSPIYHAGKSRTPTLIAHGKEDTRVHPGQSMELYRHLKLRSQAPVRLVFYPGEPHGFRRAASRLDYNLRLLRWMEHYLKGPGGAPPPRELDYEQALQGAALSK